MSALEPADGLTDARGNMDSEIGKNDSRQNETEGPKVGMEVSKVGRDSRSEWMFG